MVFPSPTHDRMATWICVRPGTDHRTDVQDSSVLYYVRADNVTVCAMDALKNGDADVQMMRDSYNQRRRYLVNAFREMGLECFEPFGAFYMFPCVKQFGMTSDEFASRLLHEEKLAVVPGNAFGDSGEGFLRISYAYSLEKLKVAMGRLGHFVERLK